MPDYSKSLSAGVRAKISIRRFFNFFLLSFKTLSSLSRASLKPLPPLLQASFYYLLLPFYYLSALFLLFFYLFPLLLLYDFCLIVVWCPLLYWFSIISVLWLFNPGFYIVATIIHAPMHPCFCLCFCFLQIMQLACPNLHRQQQQR